MIRCFVLTIAFALAFAAPAVATPHRARPTTTAAPVPVCLAGAQVSCACPGGGTGVQRCNGDGSAFDACRCLPSPSAYQQPVTRPQPPPSAPVERPHNPPTVARWYGWQTLLLDLGASALGLVAVGTGSVPIAVTSGAFSLLGPPIVHMAHGNYENAGVSVGLRALNVAMLGYAARNFADDDFGTAVIVCSVFQVGIIVMDAAWLGRDRVPAPPPAGAHLTGGNVLVLRDGAALSLAGTF